MSFITTTTLTLSPRRTTTPSLSAFDLVFVWLSLVLSMMMTSTTTATASTTSLAFVTTRRSVLPQKTLSFSRLLDEKKQQLPPLPPSSSLNVGGSIDIVDTRTADAADVHDVNQRSSSLDVVWEKSLCSTLGVPVNSFWTITAAPPSTTTYVSRPLIVGHRGCLYDELENTRQGFTKTIAMGADAFELDVFLLSCGTLVVFHGSGTDESPGLLKDYTVNMTRSVLDYTYEELQQHVVFNENYEEFGCDANKIRNGVIPTLEQVLLDAKETNCLVKIELKGPGTAEPVLKLVDWLDMQDQCHFSSFDLRQIAIVRALRPQVDEVGKHVYKTGALFNDVNDDDTDYLQRALEVGASEVHLRYDECTKQRVDEIHEAGMDSMAWFRGPIGMQSDVLDRFWDVGNEDASMYHAVMKTGVRQMCVNRPDVLVDMFR